MKRILLFLTTAFFAPYAAAYIMCYTCVSTPEDSTCLNDPEKVQIGSPVTNCSMECCTITRLEFIEDGTLSSFSRGCQNDCEKDGIYKYPDSTFLTYKTYCRSPRCNEGDGTEDPDGKGDGSNEIHGIKGKSGGIAVAASFSTLLLFLGLLILP
ncbi:glycosylphosphatidylinositol-anchored high density lipoprotein-binding protein 1-like [Macrobrachium rosenbergii]|uniref:glycosylphosphatidylinositol-anchored high density lipoprotein-binding protein 1-like n=1 Tax=Macrobrachium rosenbergii TaxID=79674 RepID=UPI0034D47E5D